MIVKSKNKSKLSHPPLQSTLPTEVFFFKKMLYLLTKEALLAVRGHPGPPSFFPSLTATAAPPVILSNLPPLFLHAGIYPASPPIPFSSAQASSRAEQTLLKFPIRRPSPFSLPAQSTTSPAQRDGVRPGGLRRGRVPLQAPGHRDPARPLAAGLLLRAAPRGVLPPLPHRRADGRRPHLRRRRAPLAARGGGAARARRGQGGRGHEPAPQLPRVRLRLPGRREAGRGHHHGQPVLHPARDPPPGGRGGGEGDRHRGLRRRQGARLRSRARRARGVCGRQPRGLPPAPGPHGRRRAARRRRGGRPRRRRRAAVLLRHHRDAQGRHAHAPQPRHQRRAAGGRREPEPVLQQGRRGALRAAAVPHLLAQLGAARRPARRVRHRDHAQVRDRRAGGAGARARRDRGALRAAHRGGDRQEPPRGRRRPRLHPHGHVRRRANGEGFPGRVHGQDSQRRARPGVRDDGGRARAGHVPGLRQGAVRGQVRLLRHRRPERRAEDRRPRHRRVAGPEPARRDLHPRRPNHERMKDELAGEVPIAFIIRTEDSEISEDEIKQFVAKEVVFYKRINKVFFTDSIPKNPSGKILRKDLRARLAAGIPSGDSTQSKN